jgi:hypothetical protein
MRLWQPFARFDLWQKEKSKGRKAAPSMAKFLVAWAVNKTLRPDETCRIEKPH